MLQGDRQSGADWAAYYARNAGRPLHPDFLRAVEIAFSPELVESTGSVGDLVAVDLGAGDGTESAFLLVRGVRVHAYDLTPGLTERIVEKVGRDSHDRLVAADSSFGEIQELPQADFIYAGLSLPFATPDELTHILGLVHGSLKPTGLFAAHFFGENDSWAAHSDVQTHTHDELSDLLADFSNVSVEDREYDAGSGTGPKHWHIRWVTARR